MKPADEYRNLAADLRDRARNEESALIRAEWDRMAISYERLAEQADKNCSADVKCHPILGR
jgi:hypothetical protein